MWHFSERDCIAFAFRAIAKTVKYDEREWAFSNQTTTPSVLQFSMPGFPVVRALLHVWIGSFHPAFRPVERNETELSIQTVRIFCRQDPAAKPLQLGMRQYYFH